MASFNKFQELLAKYQAFKNDMSIKEIPCPLCMKLKSYEELTDEHIIPKSVGGKIITLACAECNNTLGSNVDSHLKGKSQAKKFWKGNGEERGEIEVNGEKFRVTLQKKGGWQFMVPEKPNDPRKILTSVFPLDGEMKVKIRHKYSRNGWKRAIIKAAYLSAFEQKGYDYLHLPINEYIRKVIKDNVLGNSWTYMAYDTNGFSGSGSIIGDFLFEANTYSIIILGEDTDSDKLLSFLPSSEMPIYELEKFLDFLKSECGEDGKMQLTFNTNV